MIVLLGLAEAAFLAAFGWLDGVALPLPRLLLPAGAFLCYGIAGWTMTRNRDGRDETDAAATAAVWGVAVLARVSLLPLAPELSDDVYRYLWDGRVLSEGTNPYSHAPADDALTALRAPWHDRINHPDVPTIYPPVAQLLFALASAVGGTVLAAKALWLVLDLGCGLLLQRVAVRTGRRPAPVLLWYLWSPLLVVETGWSAHFDAAGLFLMAALLWLAAGRGSPRAPRARPAAMGAVLALATLVKVAPAALLPPCCAVTASGRGSPSRRRASRSASPSPAPAPPFRARESVGSRRVFAPTPSTGRPTPAPSPWWRPRSATPRPPACWPPPPCWEPPSAPRGVGSPWSAPCCGSSAPGCSCRPRSTLGTRCGRFRRRRSEAPGRSSC